MQQFLRRRTQAVLSNEESEKCLTDMASTKISLIDVGSHFDTVPTIICFGPTGLYARSTDSLATITDFRIPLDIYQGFGYTSTMVIREGKEIQTPTDDDDCAAWIMDRNRNVRFISSEELDAMPEFVTDTINIGCLAVENGLMISSSMDHLFDEEANL